MTKNKHSLSVVLATNNEEANIARCLDSVKGIADQIVVVDEYSTDKTVDIARKYKAKVIFEPHHQIFHITKNVAIKNATCDWILQLDADESLTPKLANEITKLLQDSYFGVDGWVPAWKSKFKKVTKLDKPANAYWLPRRNFFLNRYLLHTGQYPDPVIRLFRRGKAILPAKDVHEQMQVVGEIGWMTGDLDHLSSPDFSRYLRRENRYSSITATQLYKQKVKINVFNTINYLFLKPLTTFLRLFFRFRGFMDGFPGFVFSLYSGFHHAFSYMKLWEIYKDEKN